MASRRSARPHKRVQHDSSGDEYESEKELTSADVMLKAHPVVEDEKTAKIQEKNRRAQRKFRERRKERMNHMEKSIIALNDQIQALKVENRMYKELLTAKEKQLQSAKVSGSHSDTEAFSYPDYDPIDMSWLPGYGDALLSNEKIRHMSDDDLAEMCMKIFTMLDQQLRMCETATPTAVDHGKLNVLVKGGTSFWARCLLVEPVRTREIVGRIQAARRGEGEASASSTSLGFTGKMVTEVGLSMEQMRQMSQAWMKYKAALEQMLGDREACSKELMSLRPDPDNEMRNIQIFLQENKVVEQLRSTMQRENKLFLECMHEIAHKTLQPIQLARFILHGKPYMDMLSLCKAVAVELEGEDTAQLQATARQRSVLCTALENVGTENAWLDSELQSNLKALGGRLQAVQNPQDPVTSGSHNSVAPSLEARSHLTSYVPGGSSPLQSAQAISMNNAGTSLYEGLAQFRNSRGLIVDAPTSTSAGLPAARSSKAQPPRPDTDQSTNSPLTASRERNIALQDIFSTYRSTQGMQADTTLGLQPSGRHNDSGAPAAQSAFLTTQRGGQADSMPDPFNCEPRHTPLDGESAFMAPGVNSSKSLSFAGDNSHGSLGNGAVLSNHVNPTTAASPAAALIMPTTIPSLDMFSNFEAGGSMFPDTALLSRFTSTSMHLMDSSCELRADLRNDTLMSMIEKMPHIPNSTAGAHNALVDVFDAASAPPHDARQCKPAVPTHAANVTHPCK